MNFKHALCDIRVQEMLKQVPRIIKKEKNDLLPSLSFEQKTIIIITKNLASDPSQSTL